MYRRRRILVLGTLGVVLAVVFYLPITLLAPIRAASAVVAAPALPPAAAATLAWPGYGAGAITALGPDGTLGSYGGDEARSIASISKVISALVVLDAKPIDGAGDGPTIEMTSKDVGYRTSTLKLNAKVLPVTAGESFTERELLEMSLMESAANFTISSVMWAYGSNDAYVAAADAWLDAHGMTHTTIVEPTGLDPDNQSTTADLLTLGRLALADPLVAAIVGTDTTSVHDVGELDNGNLLLGGEGDGVEITGIKTGSLAEAGACLLFSADLTVDGETVSVVGVILGGPDHKTLNNDILALLASVTAGYHVVDVSDPGEVFADYATAWGGSAHAVAKKDAELLVWSDTPVTVDVAAQPVGIAANGAGVGTATFTAGTRTVAVPLTLSAAIADPGPLWRLTNPGALG